jgi:large subunit ribosomal protein L32
MVVRMRTNHSKTRMRRSHDAISGTRVSKCECGADRMAHRACQQCGKYNGRIVVDVVARATREARRAKRRGGESETSTPNKETDKDTK